MDIFNLEDWNEQAIQFILDNKLEESAKLEFKAAGSLDKADKKKEEIAKDVSAFANSDGGLLIYGLNEVNHKADSLSFIDGDEFNKEWLELIITTNISRPIEKMKIFPIRFGGDIKKTVYVVKIPISYLAPHMVNKTKRFYLRSNFSVFEMEEYQIRQTYQRKENVKLEFKEVTTYTIANKDTFITDKTINIRAVIDIKNSGNVVAKEYKAAAIFTNHIEFDLISDKTKYNFTQSINQSIISTINPILIYPKESISILEFVFVIYPERMVKPVIRYKTKLYFNSESIEVETGMGESALKPLLDVFDKQMKSRK